MELTIDNIYDLKQSSIYYRQPCFIYRIIYY